MLLVEYENCSTPLFAEMFNSTQQCSDIFES
jgi:hypothetical protein